MTAPPPAHISTAPLTESFAREHESELLALGDDWPSHSWTAAHLLADRPEKWKRSLVALDPGGQPVGYAVASKRDAAVHLHHIVVRPDQRGRGIGRSLTARIVAAARADLLAAVTLKVDAANYRAINLYRCLGFDQTGCGQGGQAFMELRLDPPCPSRKTIAIHQPNFAPWCGFFAKLRWCDTFVFLDDVQMPRGRSYVHRTRIDAQGNAHWLSVPCHRSSTTLVKDVRLAEGPWHTKHIRTLRANYGHADHFDTLLELVRPVFDAPGALLADFNIRLIRRVAQYLDLTPTWLRSNSIASHGARQERIISIVQALGGTSYLAGAGSVAYHTKAAFEEAGLELVVERFVPREYPQRQHEFIPALSILDAVAHCGAAARDLLVYR